MYVERELRDQLNALSKEIFGVASRWQKMLETTEYVTREVTETVKNEDGTETQKTAKRPVLINANPLNTKTPEGRPYRQAVRRTPEDVLTALQGLKAQIDDMKAKQKAAEELKKAEETVRESAHGSAI
jgi:hypothetical protein